MSKHCPNCNETKPLHDFHIRRASSDGRQRICKPCQRELVAQNGRNHADSSGEEEFPHADALYILGCSRLSDLKIGRAADPAFRATQIQQGQPYTARILATFPRAGHLESRVHDALEWHRVQGVPGREWFACSLDEAVAAITRTIAAHAEVLV